jgi:RNA polymerase sigma factor (sigma-70 family)
VQKNMARILAFHGLMPAQAQQLTVPPMRPDDDPQPITEQMPIFPPEDGGAGVEQHAYAPQVLLPPARPEDDPIGGGSRQAVRPEDLIVACGERVRGLARKLACGDDRLDADDLYSTGMLEICEAVAAGRLAGANDPVAYLCGVARYGMLREYRQLRGWSSISMDAPLTDDGSLTLHDILPAPSTPVPARRSRKEKSKKRLVNDALGHVTARQRAALRRRFGLVGYGKHTLNEAARSLHVPVHSVSNATHEALRALRVDYRLCKAMGVEVQV